MTIALQVLVLSVEEPMYFLTFEFIRGMNVGIEYFTPEDSDSDYTMVVVSLFFIRAVISKEDDDATPNAAA